MGEAGEAPDSGGTRREWRVKERVRVKDELRVRIRAGSETGWSHEQEGLRERCVSGAEGKDFAGRSWVTKCRRKTSSLQRDCSCCPLHPPSPLQPQAWGGSASQPLSPR